MAKVLIVEDYPSLQKIYSMTLSEAGHQITVASDGEEAKRLTETEEPDIILLDLLMPKTNGLEFLRSYGVKQHPNTEIIVFSNMDTPALKQQVLALGVGHYLTKADFTPNELLAVIDKILKNKT